MDRLSDQKIIEIWESFPQDSINSLISSFESRLRFVLSQNGESISEILRRNIHQDAAITLDLTNNNLLQIDDLIEFYDPLTNDEPLEFIAKRPFTVEEDILLLSKVNELGPRWKEMIKFFINRNQNSLRYRYNKIRGKIPINSPSFMINTQFTAFLA